VPTRPLKLTFSDVHERSAPVAAFSNGTEGDAWTEAWCFTCTHDTGGVRLKAGQREVCCPILGVALMDRTPVDLIEHRRGGLAARYRCAQYDPRDPAEDARKLLD
jgi:hypothetical protein